MAVKVDPLFKRNAAKEAAAPTSNATAKLIANHLGLDIKKKYTTWIVDITETNRYSVTKVPIINILVAFADILFF
jgi:hypothetical protein